ncbi:MAG: SPASM domain-containing protein [Bacteriovoracaceae bacterium]|nr:SPASM domain-containing protein [Bacteriovoracaceae bacterium]
MKKNQIASNFQDTQKVISKFDSKNLEVDSFCLVPFTNIILEPNGDIGICRQKGSDFTFGNLRDNSLMEIWNGEEIRKWRKEFLTGEVEVCAKEFKYKKCNLCPQNNKLLDEVVFSEVQDSPPIKLTANFNGFCNLRCQMCDVWELPNGFYTEDNFWKYARKELFPNLKEIDMLSGEPFLQDDTFKLIEEVSSINPDCEWTITTNAHYQLSGKIKEYLNSITFKNLIISIDSINSETYSLIRKRGKLETVLQTLDDYVEYEKERIANSKSPLNIKLNFLIQKDNWKELKSILEFCNSNSVSPFITFCYFPDGYSLLDLDVSERLDILRFWLRDMDYVEISTAARVIRPLVDSLNGIDKAEIVSTIQNLKSLT